MIGDERTWFGRRVAPGCEYSFARGLSPCCAVRQARSSINILRLALGTVVLSRLFVSQPGLLRFHTMLSGLDPLTAKRTVF